MRRRALKQADDEKERQGDKGKGRQGDREIFSENSLVPLSPRLSVSPSPQPQEIGRPGSLGFGRGLGSIALTLLKISIIGYHAPSLANGTYSNPRPNGSSWRMVK